MNETAINTAAVEQIDRVVSEQLTAYIKEIGLPIRLVDMTVGAPILPMRSRISASRRPRKNSGRTRRSSESSPRISACRPNSARER